MTTKLGNDSIGDRMKAYERCFAFDLPRRMPLIVRVDGRAFHTLTARMSKPFDAQFCDAMLHSASALAESMQGFVLAYVQSDEASFFLQDYAEITTQPWFGKDLSKIVSISASRMSVTFSVCLGKDALFDGRAFVLPETDVANYFLWRAKDWSRNSLQMYSRAHFSHKQLHNKGRDDMHNMLHAIGKNWTTDLSARERNGTFLLRSDNGIVQKDDVLPSYQSVADVLALALAVSP